MPEYIVVDTFSNENDRNVVRMRVVHKLSEEIRGQGTKDLASRYTYFVETLSDGKRVYLRRPANLHWGFDFVVCVEDINFNRTGKKRNYPKHEDIINDLMDKASENRKNYNKLFELMKKIYECKDVNFGSSNAIPFEGGYPNDLILSVLKWLFIEQDIRYWNYSGRDMLWEKIKEI